jgi:nitrogen regulatory protein P-II 2
MSAMNRVALEVVTIVAETVLEESLTRGLVERGATGYTVTESQGKGSRGIRSGDVPGESVRIETVVDRATSDRVLNWIQESYFPNYAVIAWVTPAEVLRGDKYVAS